MNGKRLPTTDLYFLNSCGAWVRRWWRDGPVERLGANSFRCGDRFLLIRRDSPALMERALDWPGRLIYLIDDDIDSAARSPGIPESYQQRLKEFANGFYDRLVLRSIFVVASSERLLGILRADARIRGETRMIDPYWCSSFADQQHFRKRDRFEIVHLGSGSHSGGLARITDALLELLDRNPQARLSFIGRPGEHPRLEAHPGVRLIVPMRWGRYRRWLPRQRFHLALYPLAPTPFDQARSRNKVIEHAIVGAVGVYHAYWKPAARISGGVLWAPDDPAEWGNILAKALDPDADLQRLAAEAAHALTAQQFPDFQRRFWADILEI